MKKILVLFLSAFLLTTLTGMASAATYIFDPNDLINLYDQGNPLGTPDPANPRSIKGGDYTGYTTIGDWNTAGYGSTLDEAIKNDYLNWRDQDGGYITGFNIWLADNPRARGWGEQLVIEPNTGLSATAASGWQVEVSTNQWYPDLFYASWWTDDINNALKIGGNDLDNFSFSANLYVDVNQNGWDPTDPLAVLGVDYTIWFGGYVGNASISPDDEVLLFQGTLDIAPVPEPATLALFGFGLLGIASISRKKRS